MVELTKDSSLSQACEYFTNKMQEIIDANNHHQKLVAQYKAETRDYFGVSDGEALNMIQLIKIMEKVVGDKV